MYAQMSDKLVANMFGGPKLEATPLERQLCAHLAKLVAMEAEWRYSPCGALQCAAAERNKVICFIVETKPPKLPLTYCKFDFCNWEAEELAGQLSEFLLQSEAIVDDSKAEAHTKSSSVTDKAQQMKDLKKTMKHKDPEGDEATLQVVKKRIGGQPNSTSCGSCF